MAKKEEGANKPIMDAVEQYREKYDVKMWANIHVTHLNYLRNLIFTLAVGLLVYIVNKMLGGDLYGWVLISYMFSGLLVAFSLINGGRVFIKSSENYRLKWQISKDINASTTNQFRSNIKSNQDTTSILENEIKSGFKWQVITFIFALVAIGLAIIIIEIIDLIEKSQ